MDDGFWYAVPDTLTGRVEVGSLVRVPLGSRRVRGYVVELAPRPSGRLREIHAVTGDLAVFDPELLDVLRWAAHRYVAPLAVLLERAAPPNVAREVPCPATSRRPGADGELAEWVARVVGGVSTPPTYLLERPGRLGWVTAVAAVAGDGRSAMVVAPTEIEASQIAEAARTLLGSDTVDLVVPSMGNRDTTTTWAKVAACPGRLVVGTPRITTWPIAGPSAFVAVEESRRAMKERQTPTLAVRELLRRRALRHRAALLFVGPTPSVEALAVAPEVRRSSGRLWSHVEVVDRRGQGGLLTPDVRRAIAATVSAGRDVFLFSHRRGYAPASRCVACGTVRRCPRCGSRPDRGEACGRCGASLGACPECGRRRFEPLGAGVGRVAAEARRIVDRVVEAPDHGPVVVGSERDLPNVGRPSLAVIVDADGLILASHYRAVEEALRIMARVAGIVSEASGSRTMVQTAMPDHPIFEALRRADPVPLLVQETQARASFGYPPAGELLVVEIRGGAVDDVDAQIARAAGDATVHGPAATPRGRRWLIQGADLAGCRTALRSLVQTWRDAGATVRVDADPIDL